jgi:tetratricopeptide (TPR) repeat protein
LANALVRKRKFQESVSYYKKAIHLKNNYAEANSNLGIVLGEQGKLDEAMEQYQKALKINPDLFQVHNSLVILLA